MKPKLRLAFESLVFFFSFYPSRFWFLGGWTSISWISTTGDCSRLSKSNKAGKFYCCAAVKQWNCTFFSCGLAQAYGVLPTRQTVSCGFPTSVCHWDRILLGSSGLPRTPDSPASASQVLRFQAWAIIPIKNVHIWRAQFDNIFAYVYTLRNPSS